MGRGYRRTRDAVTTWEEFWQAYARQTRAIIRRSVELYEHSEAVRARFFPTPYLSCLVKGCAEKGLDINQGGAELGFVTIEAVTYATTVDSLLAVKYLVFDETPVHPARAGRGAARQLGRAREAAGRGAAPGAEVRARRRRRPTRMAKRVMDLWTEETWKHKTRSTGRQFRPGMLSWNYWIADADILPASPDGRARGKFLSNAICPSNGADSNGPTANVNSVGKVLGGKAADGQGDWQEYRNLLPNGGSHTITFNPSMLRDPEHQAEVQGLSARLCRKRRHRAADQHAGCRDAARRPAHPEDYRHLLVRVTGYNAYFTAIGKELQDEIIARESHAMK